MAEPLGDREDMGALRLGVHPIGKGATVSFAAAAAVGGGGTVGSVKPARAAPPVAAGGSLFRPGTRPRNPFFDPRRNQTPL